MERVVLAHGQVCNPHARRQAGRLRDATRCTAPTFASTFPPVPSDTLHARVERALAKLQNPRLNQDVVSAGMVKDLAVDDRGQVTFTFVLTQADPPTLAREARKTVQGVAGVAAVRVTLTDAGAAAGAAAPRQLGTRPAPGAVPPPPTPVELPNLGKVLAISSGKGGVGKSTVSANLAVALARQGQRVGLMDADIYGPNIPRMLGVDQKPERSEERRVGKECRSRWSTSHGKKESNKRDRG